MRVRVNFSLVIVHYDRWHPPFKHSLALRFTVLASQVFIYMHTICSTSGQVLIRQPLKHFNLCTLKEDRFGFVDLEVLRMVDAKTATI